MARRRRGWKKGDWLVRDEETGFVEYASRVTRDYYGVLTRYPDRIHPQTYIRAKNDPYVSTERQNPPALVYDTSAYNASAFVYGTNVPLPMGPAVHIVLPNLSTGGSPSDPGIGEMAVGTSFIIR